MTSKAARAEQKIKRVCDELGISEAGHFWLDHAVDPFKDLPRAHSGYPDKCSEPSIVEVVKKTVTVSSGLGAIWDMMFFLDNVNQIVNLRQTSISSGEFLTTGQGVTDFKRGGLIVRKAASGASLDITTTDNNSCIDIDPLLYTNEECRVISIGIEAHDTTQELKKQGTVVVFKVDQPPDTPDVRTAILDSTPTACIPIAVQAQKLVTPPALLSDALDLVGSRQWDAQEGCYIVPTQASDVNLPQGIKKLAPFATENALTYFPQLSTAGAANRITLTGDATTPSVWSMSGAFFSGLDPAATITINFNYIVERFPNRSSSIKRLCYPSPPYDPKAMELYSRVAREMPVGVPVGENGIGDWLAGIANLAAGALSLIPHPIPKAIGAGITALGNNKQVQMGVKQLADKIEKKVEKKLEIEMVKEVRNHPEKCGTLVVYNKPTNGTGGPSARSAVQNGTFSRKKDKRPDRLAQYGQAAYGPDSPWMKKKAKSGKQ